MTSNFYLLSSTIIETLLEKCAASPKYACAYFFFDNRSAQTDLSLHDKFIRSIIRQLAYQTSGLPVSLLEVYNGRHRQPSISSLHLTLRKIIGEFERTYMIVDALDECADRGRMLLWLAQTMQQNLPNLHILVSSRREFDIENQLNSVASLVRIPFIGTRADADIELYLDAMLSKMWCWDSSTLMVVRQVLVTGAGGMFVLISQRTFIRILTIH